MARLTRKHKEIIHGRGKCSRPMWSGAGGPAGFCDKPAYGRPDWEGMLAWKRRDMGHVPALACPGHGGPTLEEYLAGRTVVRFDGPPGHDAGRLVEVERNGESVRAGTWIADGDDWLLVLDDPEASP